MTVDQYTNVESDSKTYFRLYRMDSRTPNEIKCGTCRVNKISYASRKQGLFLVDKSAMIFRDDGIALKNESQ
jgi:hypothetical protein